MHHVFETLARVRLNVYRNSTPGQRNAYINIRSLLKGNLEFVVSRKKGNIALLSLRKDDSLPFRRSLIQPKSEIISCPDVQADQCFFRTKS